MMQGYRMNSKSKSSDNHTIGRFDGIESPILELMHALLITHVEGIQMISATQCNGLKEYFIILDNAVVVNFITLLN